MCGVEGYVNVCAPAFWCPCFAVDIHVYACQSTVCVCKCVRGFVCVYILVCQDPFKR